MYFYFQQIICCIISGGARLTRVDPRITKGKKVSFADGFAPGQDSDCENELANSVVQYLYSNYMYFGISILFEFILFYFLL